MVVKHGQQTGTCGNYFIIFQNKNIISDNDNKNIILSCTCCCSLNFIGAKFSKILSHLNSKRRE